jgi:hypothetical protein
MSHNPNATQKMRIESLLEGVDTKTMRTYSRAQSIASARIKNELERNKNWEKKKLRIDKVSKR